MRIIIAGTENITWNLYNGNQRSMLITNCIFRLGGVALMLSNHPADMKMAKYKLKHMVRTHMGSSDEAYKCASTPAPIFHLRMLHSLLVILFGNDGNSCVTRTTSTGSSVPSDSDEPFRDQCCLRIHGAMACERGTVSPQQSSAEDACNRLSRTCCELRGSKLTTILVLCAAP